MRDVDPVGRELDPQRVGHRLERELRDRVGAEERQRAPAGDRADDDDAALRGPQRREHRLGDGELADDVDLELAAELVERQVLERRGDRDARVVDEPVEPRRSVRARDRGGSVTSRITSVVPGGASPGRAARPRSTRQPPRGEPRRARGADPGGRARDQDGVLSQGARRRSRRAARPGSRRRPGSTAPACSSGAAGAPR